MTREAWIVVDLGFGDAGKGAIVDFLARDRGAGLVVRWNGGAQAGHTVVTDDGREHTFSQFGAGSFVPGVRTHLGPAFVLHPGGMLVEARRLAGIGVPDGLARTTVDRRALVITPFQQAAGRIRELARGRRAHGTCGVGVGEAVGDALTGHDDVVRVGDLEDPDRLARLLHRQRERKRLEAPYAEVPAAAADRARPEWGVLSDRAVVPRILDAWAPLLGDLRIVDPEEGRRLVHDAGAVVFEGAQGVLLDETWGFHPHTTWSDCTPAGARALLAGADVHVTTLGVLRAYATRHGAGPLPTADPAFDDALPEPHNGDAGWQGAFRSGPLDLTLLRYALEVANGVDGLAVNHVDRVAAWPRVPVVDGYAGEAPPELVERDGARIRRLVPGPAADLGWRERLGGVLGRVQPIREEVRPDALGARIEAGLGVPVRLAGEGATASGKRWVGGG